MAKLLYLSFYFLLMYLRPCSSDCSKLQKPKKGFNGMFVFGDSTVDNGNNNYLKTMFKANYQPYGIDFPSRPTGRLTNGKNPADAIADLLKLPPVPAFFDPKTKGVRLSNGVNFASAGSGTLDATGAKMGAIGLPQQVRNFVESTLPNMETQLGCPKSELLGRYLFLFSTGSNDFLEGFFQKRSGKLSLELFTDLMIFSVIGQIIRLYNEGARKFVFINIGALGCTPMIRSSVSKRACNESLNYAAYLFNERLVPRLSFLTRELPGFYFVSVNFFQISLMFKVIPSTGGFTDISNPCCQVSMQSGGVACTPGGAVCLNRNAFLYFDGMHPTEAAYSKLAAIGYNTNDSSEAFPFNIQTLSEI